MISTNHVLLLRKGLCPYAYMDDCKKKINETSLAEKEDFYSYLNMKDNTHVH